MIRFSNLLKHSFITDTLGSISGEAEITFSFACERILLVRSSKSPTIGDTKLFPLPCNLATVDAHSSLVGYLRSPETLLSGVTPEELHSFRGLTWPSQTSACDELQQLAHMRNTAVSTGTEACSLDENKTI